MIIQLKTNVNVEEKNKELRIFKLKGEFNTEKSNIGWLKDINENPKSPQKHLKPKNRDLTIKELKEMFPKWTKVGCVEFDLYFDRTSEEEMCNIVKFLEKNQHDIEYITEVDMFIKRGNIENKYHALLNSLIEKPIELPENEKQLVSRETLGGQLLCKSLDGKPFYVNFGMVEYPTFMKDKIYTKEEFNPEYRDENGYRYMLIPLPLMRMSSDLKYYEDFKNLVYYKAKDLGLKENIYFFMSYIYKYYFEDIEKIAEEFKSYYTEEDLLERLQLVLNKCKYELLLTRSLGSKFKLIMQNNGLFKLKMNSILLKKEKEDYKGIVNLLNALLLSLRSITGKPYYYVFNTENDKHSIKFKKYSKKIELNV